MLKGPKKVESGGGGFGEGQPSPPHHLGGLGSAVSSLTGVRCGAPAAQTFSYILSALDVDGVSCCILGAFCTKKLYAMQRGKGSVRLLEAM